MAEMIRATGFLTITPNWRGDKLVGASLDKVTKGRPYRPGVGDAVVKLTVELPARVFRPFLAEAEITAQEGEIGVTRVVIEPWADEEGATE